MAVTESRIRYCFALAVGIAAMSLRSKAAGLLAVATVQISSLPVQFSGSLVRDETAGEILSIGTLGVVNLSDSS